MSTARPTIKDTKDPRNDQRKNENGSPSIRKNCANKNDSKNGAILKVICGNILFCSSSHFLNRLRSAVFINIKKGIPNMSGLEIKSDLFF